ncbi:MAG: PPOX class F420-dependent oxidoreductase [Actinobacteria bacterium]|nr:PPOX class F420-dependent oxidoreductase [Actinomycetota bacterium]MDQ3532574.1 PPOX class F420-dependent oxidoreductase [Actinomycetota bacterium]
MLEDKVRRLARGPNFATITTLLADGGPATHVMWIDCDDEHLLVNTETGRAKFRNVQRDPRVSVVIWDRDDAYSYIEVRGRVVETVAGPEARRHIDELSEKYHGKPYANKIETERVILKVAPARQRSR